MSDIVKREPTYTEIRANQQVYPRIMNMQSEVVLQGLTAMLQKAAMLRGQKTDELNIAFTASELMKELMNDEYRVGTANISLMEIWKAIKKAILGMGDKVYGINVASLYRVIVDYCTGEGHAAQREVNAIISSAEAERRRERMKDAQPMIDTMAGRMVRSRKIK